MSISKIHFGSAVVVGGLVVAACSASSSDPGTNGGALGSSGSGAGLFPGQGASSAFGNGGGGPINPGGPASGGGGPIFGGGTQPVHKPDGGVCNAIRQTPETVIVYHDASFTDTITTYKPVALFIMQDRSSSMVTGMPAPASAQSWANSTTAVTAFVNDPRTQGIDVGLGVFPPMNFTDLLNQGDCATGSDCGTPLVPIAPLPGNGGAIVNGYNQANPQQARGTNFTPTECALRGMINTCLQYMAQSATGEQCVAVLVTDGTPTTCSTDQSALTKIVADGHASGITTYVLGLPGSDANFLNQLANVGGTSAAINVSGGSQAFIDALNNIRQAIAVTTTTAVTTTSVVSTPLPCQWKIPPVAPPQVFDPKKVNVQFTPPGGAVQQFGHVGSVGECGKVNGDAWYYDNNAAPTQVLVCPQTCSGTLKNSAGAQVDVLLGCDTIPALFH